MTKSTVKTKNNDLIRQKYNSFIKNLDIEDIRLLSATIQNIDCYYFPSSAEVRWKMTASYENRENKIEVFQCYNVRILEKGKELKAKIAINFHLTYNSKIPMPQEFFDRFKNQNLPLNTWPYFREFVHNAVIRMGWPPFIAPSFVI